MSEAAAKVLKTDQVLTDLCQPPLPETLLGQLPAKIAHLYRVIPVQATPAELVLAMAPPLDPNVQDELAALCGVRVKLQAATQAAIEAALAKYYGEAETVASVLADLSPRELEGAGEDEALNAALIGSQTMGEGANDAPVIKLVNLLIQEAVKRRASDIHIEPFEREIKVRYRIDGLLYDVPPPPKRLYWALTSRIKIMAGMNIAEKRLPQDGRIRIKVLGHHIDMRISTSPTIYGESVVMRILDRTQVLLQLGDLGFTPQMLPQFQRLLAYTHGIILVTGPTGSGKTTTLYAALSHLNSPTKKIITVEDPVEYQLAGINQMPVRHKIGFDFANGLRTILRQDPDIIMVGEIRDRETAEMAIQAALTGHLVLSTLHTNDAASAITRLLDMGIEDFLVASTLRGILAQRLVRVLCPNCRVEAALGSEEASAFGTAARTGRVYKANGCPDCGGIGYRGRTGIYELLLLAENIQALIMKHTNAAVIKQAAVQAGMRTLLEDGWEKIRSGITTAEEVLRVTQE